MGAGVPLLCGCRSLWCGGPPASSPLLTMVGLPLRHRSSSSGASHLLVVVPRGGGGLHQEKNNLLATGATRSIVITQDYIVPVVAVVQ